MPDFEPAPASVVVLRSRFDFEATIARLKTVLTGRGMTIFVDIDQSAAAFEVGMSLRPTRLLLFGNPRGGTPVMEANPHAALELPLRLVVWQASHGVVWVDYLAPAVRLIEEFGVAPALTGGFGAVPALLAQAVEAVADEPSGASADDFAG